MDIFDLPVINNEVTYTSFFIRYENLNKAIIIHTLCT